VIDVFSKKKEVIYVE